MIKQVFKVHTFLVKNRNIVVVVEIDVSSMSLHTYYNPQIIKFVLFIPKNLWPSIQWVKYLFNFVKSSLNLKYPIKASISSYKAIWQPNRYNKYYWPSSKWNQIFLMYILKIIYINNRECAHCGLYPHFMDLTERVSVHTSLNFIKCVPETPPSSYQTGIWKAYWSVLNLLKM